ncbi:MAG: hypothetical protein KAH05_04890 [Clostridiales bacterium]|nr:hypothetical protein [Clostridiales bacterium]
MTKVLSIKSKGGFDNFIKINSTLKRRRFYVDKVSMENVDESNFNLEITLKGDENTLNQAIRHMQKIEDVYDIKEKMEE